MNRLYLLLTFIGLFSYAECSAQAYELSSVHNTTITACAAELSRMNDYDRFWGSCSNVDDYCNNEDYWVTFCSGTPGVPIRATFTFYNIEVGFDQIRVYDGPSIASPLIGSFDGLGISDGTNFTSSGTCLTIRLTSDNIVTYANSGYKGGFTAILGCEPQICSNGNTPANDACSFAPQICDLNGYCGNTSGWYTPGPEATTLGSDYGGIFCGSIENNSWIAFEASSTSATFDFTSTNCTDPSSGIQMQIFSTPDCNSFSNVSNCVNQTTGSGTGTITATGLTVGQTYYIMVDGYGGNICDYSISANSGVAIVDVTSSNGGASICPSQCVDLTVNASGATSYSWSSGGVSATETVCPAATTTYSVDVTGVCGGTETASFTVNVNSPTVDFHAEEPIGTILSPFPTTLSCTDNVTYLVANDSATAGGYITPALHFVFISDGFATIDNTSVTIYDDGTPIWSQSPLNDNETLTVYGEYLSPTSNYTFDICDNFGDGGVDWEVYDGNSGALLGSGTLISGNPCESFGPFSPGGISTWTSTAPGASFATTNMGYASFDPGVAGPGTYDFTYCFDNQAGCSGCNTRSITVTNPYVATWSAPAPLCVNDGVIDLNTLLGATATTGGTWSGTGVSGSNFDPSVAGANTHSITYTVGGAPPCNATETHSIIVNPNPTPTITGDTDYCAGNTASVSTQAYSNYVWSNGANTQATTVTAADNTITVTVTDANGCTGTSPGYNVTENPNPTPTITGDTDYCAGNTASISTQVYPNYVWSNGANTQSTTVTAADNTITVTVTDANGCTGTSPGYNVTENPNPTPTITGDTDYCAGNTAAISTQAYSNYVWSNGANTQTTNVTTADNTITVTVTDANGCTGTSPGYNVTENPNPTPTITGDTDYCAGNTASISTQAYSNYVWSNGANTQTTNVTAADNTITVTVTDANGCSGTSPGYNVTENPSPTPTITGDTDYCAGNTASISTQVYPNYVWSNGANTQATTVTAADNTITVTVTDGNGCTGISPGYNVTENPNPTPTITGDTDYCAGNTASVSTQVYSNYVWSNGANTQATNVTTADNTITVTVTDANGCTGTSPGYNVTENPNPTPTITGDTDYCAGNTASVSTQAYSNYVWSNGANTQATTVTAADNTITVTVTDANGCTGTSPGYNVTENPNPTPTITGDTDY
ncbi:MAG: hypothetical protein R3277_13190, partial [Brumimicrobium sp.]|nr:hypothetical protein [Brumimicrobium sp.]